MNSRKEHNYHQSQQDFAAAKIIAARGGLFLRECEKGIHYQLSPFGAAGWLLNIYPTKCRIWRDPKRPRAPFIVLPEDRDWTLVDVATGAIEAVNAGVTAGEFQ